MKSNNCIRRSKSTCLMSDVIKQQLQYRTNSPDQPIHENVESYFSTSSGFTNFRGLLNLCIILLVLSNVRVALENIIKYGILIKPFLWFELVFTDPYQWPCTSLLFVSNVFIFTIYLIEHLLEKGKIHKTIALGLQVFTLVSMLLYSCYVVLSTQPSPLISAPVLGVYTVLFLKLWSYIHVNKWCRDNRDNELVDRAKRSVMRNVNGMISTSGLDLAKMKTADRNNNNNHSNAYNHNNSSSNANSNPNGHGDQIDRRDTDHVILLHFQSYPDNLNLKDLYYFIVAPTLCYELNFPRTLKIRKKFLWKRTLELIFLPQLVFCLIQQWILPLLHNSVTPFSQSHFSVVIERMLKLSIPNHLIWLMLFYAMFHSGLNVCAELLYFGDRLFYKDWWNAKTVTEFWSTWNIPVHRWARRHIFKPMLKRKYSKLTASVVVFFISAFFHEFLVSVPLRMFRLWSFTAMIGQVPFAMFVSKYLKRSQAGNFAVWISLIIGQPLAMMMYFHDYYVQNMLSD